MSLTKNKQPGEAFSFPDRPENPILCQEKRNQAGRTSKRDPAIASSPVRKPPCPHRSKDHLSHPETPEQVHRTGKRDPALARGSVQEAPCSLRVQDSPFLTRDCRAARGHGKEILSHPFSNQQTSSTAQPKKNVFYSLKQHHHHQESVGALVIPDKANQNNSTKTQN